jgi:hypothetical protein
MRRRSSAIVLGIIIAATGLYVRRDVPSRAGAVG